MSISYKPLWLTLVKKDLTKTQLREAVGISTSTLAKMSKNEYVALEVIDKICGHLEVQPNDVFAHVGDELQKGD